MSLSVRSLPGPSPRSLRDLTTLVDQVIVKEIQKAPGVGRVAYSGGTARQVQIQIDPRRMASYGVGIDQVMDAIRQSNQNVAAGLISNARNETLVRVEGKIKNIEDFGRIIVARRGGNVGISSLGSSGVGDAPVFLSQVATISDGEQEAQSIGRNDGQPALSVQVFKIQDANIVETGDAVKKAIVNLQKRLPPGVEIRELYANSDWVKRSLDGVKKTLLEGGLLTVLIVFLFLRSWRSTIITGLTLPIAVMSTFIVLNAFGFTLNFMTMMALSLCIGLLIDDAIVVRENIVRHLHMGKSHRQAAEDGTNEIGLAVMATTFAIVAVFVPVAFMSGIVGKFFFSFGITVTAAVLVSLFVSFTLDPMLSSLWHDPGEKSRTLRFWPLRVVLDAFEHFVQWMHRVYGRLLGWAFGERVFRFWRPVQWLLFVVCLPIAAVLLVIDLLRYLLASSTAPFAWDARVCDGPLPRGRLDHPARHRAVDRVRLVHRGLRTARLRQDRQRIHPRGRPELDQPAPHHPARREPRIRRSEVAPGRGRDRRPDRDRRDRRAGLRRGPRLGAHPAQAEAARPNASARRRTSSGSSANGSRAFPA